MATKNKTTIVTQEEADSDHFRSPSNFYVVNCNGDLVFYSTKKREIAQQMADAEFGVGKYNIRVWKI